VEASAVDDSAPLMHADWQRWFQALQTAIERPISGVSPEQITMTGPHLLGRTTAGTGGAEEISVSSDTNVTLTLSALTLSAGWSGTLAVTRGGTGLGTLTTGDLWYGSAANTASRRAIGSTGDVLTVSGGLPVWAATSGLGTGDLTRTNDTNVTLTLGGAPTDALFKDVSLTLGWAGTLAVTRGGTGLSTVATGDLYYGSAADVVSRLAIGSSTNVLTVTGGLPVWAAPAAAATSVIVDDTTTNAVMFPVWVTANTGSLPLKVTSTKLSFNPSTGFFGVNTASPNAPITIERDALAATATDGCVIQNVTAATALVPVQTSPRLRFRSNVWNTTGGGTNNTQDWFIENRPTSATSPTGVLRFGTSFNGGTERVNVLQLQASSNNAGDIKTLTLNHDDNTTGTSSARIIVSTGGSSGGDPSFQLGISGGNNWSIGLDNSDNDNFKIGQNSAVGTSTALTIDATLLGVGIGVSTITAALHLKAGTSTASTAPFKFTSGTNLTTAEAGAMEYNGTNLFFTRAGTVRENMLVAIDNVAAPGTSVGIGIVNYYGTSATNFLGDPPRWMSVNVLGTTYKSPLYT
jgi:hypothetical protein